jgi:hypothetical protein
MTKTFGKGIDGVHGLRWNVSMEAKQEEAWPGTVVKKRVLMR